MNLPQERKEPTRLEKDEVEKAREIISPEWKIEDTKAMKRMYKLPDFKKSLNFVNAIGNIAEELNHHPDIFLAWGKVEVTCSTHTVGGLSKNDFDLAEKIDAEYATFI